MFCEQLVQGEEVQKMSAANRALWRATATFGGGLVGFLTSRYPNFSSKQVENEMEKLLAICDMVALRLDTGAALLALFVDADGLDDEMLVGKSVLIKERLAAFKPFTMRTVLVSRGVYADTFFIFTDSSKAYQFRHRTQQLCKHSEIFGKTYVFPWGIDISAKSVWGYKGWPPVGSVAGLKQAKIESDLFSN